MLLALAMIACMLLTGLFSVHASEQINVNIPIREHDIGGMVLLEAKDGTSQQTIAVGSYASANFALTYTEPGTYTYTIHQSSVYDNAVKDETSYLVYVVIESSDSGLSSAVVAMKEGDSKSQDIVFTNTKANGKDEKKDVDTTKQEDQNDGDLKQDSGHTGDASYPILWMLGTLLLIIPVLLYKKKGR